eukprot:GHVU01039653.1.p3 GENE.GHVU01039653.1~~GHVU01039653.1.p3  ORF type:complete len:117 (+),score=6.19 GHVU01039653.1:592-942(+)
MCRERGERIAANNVGVRARVPRATTKHICGEKEATWIADAGEDVGGPVCAPRQGCTGNGVAGDDASPAAVVIDPGNSGDWLGRSCVRPPLLRALYICTCIYIPIYCAGVFDTPAQP